MNFDALGSFALEGESRELAEKIHTCTVQVLAPLVGKDRSILDLATYEIVRSYLTGRHQSALGQPQFTKQFIKEFKKPANREALGHLFSIAGDLGKSLNLLTDVYLQMFIDERPIIRRELFGEYLNAERAFDLDRNVPFWVQPRLEFSRTLFFFRWSMLLSQCGIARARPAAFHLYAEILGRLKKNCPHLVRDLHAMQFGRSADLVAETNKAIASKLCVAWAILFTHHDYMSSLRWKRIASRQGDFIFEYVVNTLGSLSICGYRVLLEEAKIPRESVDPLGSAGKFDAVNLEISRHKLPGRTVKFKSVSNHDLLRLAKTRGGFAYHRLIFRDPTIPLIGPAKGSVTNFLLAHLLV